MGAGGAGGPYSGIGVRPGMGAGAPGVPNRYDNNDAARNVSGTYYKSSTDLTVQSNAFRASATGYPAYSSEMWGAHPGAWAPKNMTSTYVYGNPGYRAVASQLGLAATPIPYDYGSNVVAQSNAVYVNGDPYGTPQEYGTQASQIAALGQSDSFLNVSSAQDQAWVPLGVFAVVAGDETTSDDTFQLAFNPQGAVRGNYHNRKSDQVEAMYGSVDKKTQRAAWTIGTDQYPVYEAGIANLTKDATTMLIHTGDGQPPRQMSLIRLPSP